MAHEQGNKPGDDPNKYGLKFDSEKPRWELIPKIELIKIVKIFNEFLPKGESDTYYLNLKKFDRENLINDILNKIIMYGHGFNARLLGPKHSFLSIMVFEMFFLLRNESYTDFDLNRSTSDMRWDLINMKDVEGIVNVYTFGAKKYDDWNWIKVNKNRYYDALLRHFVTVRTPERYDTELGCLHLHQAIWNAIALMWIENQIPESIMKAAQKLKGISPLKVKPLKKKAAKKKVVKKKAAKKKKSASIRNPKSGKD